eukprot:6936232-Pyramimonas_sp.AAC.1
MEALIQRSAISWKTPFQLMEEARASPFQLVEDTLPSHGRSRSSSFHLVEDALPSRGRYNYTQ